MVEPEIAFAELDQLMQLAEDFTSFIVGQVIENRAETSKPSGATCGQAAGRRRVLSSDQL